MPTVVITGSAGLVGSTAVHFYAKSGFQVVGVDNDLRAFFFGNSASTSWNRQRLEECYGEIATGISIPIFATAPRSKEYSGNMAAILLS